MKLNIFGIDSRLLLLTLYNNAKQQGPAYDEMPVARLLGLRLKPGKLDFAKAVLVERLDSDNFYFDYINLGSGPKPIFVNLADIEPDFSRYDHHHGIGLAKKIVTFCRKQTISNLNHWQKMSDEFHRYEKGGILARLIEIDASESTAEDLEQLKSTKPRAKI